jgi:hypothetical protein
VLLARQSSEVPVQYQHQGTAAVIPEPPWTTFVIDQRYLGEYVALRDGVLGGHTRSIIASLMPLPKVGVYMRHDR